MKNKVKLPIRHLFTQATISLMLVLLISSGAQANIGIFIANIAKTAQAVKGVAGVAKAAQAVKGVAGVAKTAKAAKGMAGVGKAAQAARGLGSLEAIAKILKAIPEHTLPSLKVRQSYKLSIEQAAAVVFQANRSQVGSRLLSVYVGLDENHKLTYISNGQKFEFGSVLDDVSFESDLRKIESALLKHGKSKFNSVDIYAEADILRNSGFQKTDFGQHTRVYAANLHGSSWETYVAKTLVGQERFIKITPSLVIRAGGDNTLRNALLLTSEKINKDDIKIIALFERKADPETIEAIEKIAGRHNIPSEAFSLATIELEFAKSEGKIFIFVGHTENGKFVIRDAMYNPISSFDIDEIDVLAAKHKVTSIFLGCETADLPGVSGFCKKVNSLDIAKQLDRALRSQTYGDFLSNIGSPEIPLIIDKATVEHERILIQARHNNERKNGVFTTVSISSSARFIPSSIWPTIVEWTIILMSLLLFFYILISIWRINSKKLGVTESGYERTEEIVKAGTGILIRKVITASVSKQFD
jgi:hypothetical protein